VALDIRDGELLVVMGQSGSGKTTLLNLIGALDIPTSGQIVGMGLDLSAASERRRTRYRRAYIGFVFQFFNLIPTLSALENVQVAVEISPHPGDAREALRLVGLGDRADFFPSQLSGGQQQRVAIARAVAANPRLLLCDEPTGNLDSTTSAQILALLGDIHHRLGKTVVVITHNHEVARIGDRVVTLRDGELLVPC
jgi:putative ABC transport system ATP-binding protein